MFLTDFALREGEADDYAAFMGFLIDPLFRAGLATLILDNTGHRDTGRARGSITKNDLNEVMLSLEVAKTFDQHQKGQLRLKVKDSRFGNRGDWTMAIGGGEFGSWKSTDTGVPRSDFLKVVTQALEQHQPQGQDKLIDFARQHNVSIGTTSARRMLARYVDSDETPVVSTSRGYALRRPREPTPH
jgi:hypothetical protein